MSSLFMEDFYLPQKVGTLPDGPWLVVAPHSDDETFGMGGSILLASASGVQIDVLVMTDGALGGNGEDLASLREQEAQVAVSALGCRSIQFLRLPDRGLHLNIDTVNSVVEKIIDNQYQAVFFPSPVEPHPDHRTTANITWAAMRKTNFISTPISYEISVQGPINTLIDITSVVEKKRQVMMVYTSQLTENLYIDRVLALNISRTWSLPMNVRHAEGFCYWQKWQSPIETQLWSLQRALYSPKALPIPDRMVSIIVRTVARPEMLREALRSIASQLYSNIELIVVNDGEHDWSQLVKEEAQGSITSYQYLTTIERRGRAHAANVGLKHAKGEYIGFLDDDDWLLPLHIKFLADALNDNPNTMVCYSGVDGVSIEDGIEVFKHRFNSVFNPVKLLGDNFIPIHAPLFRRACIEQGCFFDERLEIYEDWNFWMKMARFGDFLHINAITAKYRSGANSGLGLPNDKKIDLSAARRKFVEVSSETYTLEELLSLVNINSAYYQQAKK